MEEQEVMNEALESGQDEGWEEQETPSWGGDEEAAQEEAVEQAAPRDEQAVSPAAPRFQLPPMPQLERHRAERAARERKNQVKEFFDAFPGVQAEDIPQQVWERVKGGSTLTAAYAMHRNQLLEAELAAERQNWANFKSSVGSMASAGEREVDEYAEGWED